MAQERSSSRTLSPLQGVALWLSLTALAVVIVALIFSLFHQQVVPSHTHDPHPKAGAVSALLWIDSEQLGITGPTYNYTSKPFTAPTTGNFTAQWSCYPSPLSDVSDYNLSIVTKDTKTGGEQSAIVACNEIAPRQGTTQVQLDAGDSYTIAISSVGPWTVSVNP